MKPNELNKLKNELAQFKGSPMAKVLSEVLNHEIAVQHIRNEGSKDWEEVLRNQGSIRVCRKLLKILN